MTLRVNPRRGSVEQYLALLAGAGRGARRVGPQALVLDAACAVESLPGSRDGRVSVQDAGAQLAAPLLDPQPAQRVLDACAAPGGKTTHLLELADCRVTALDVGEDACARCARTSRGSAWQPAAGPSGACWPATRSARTHWWDGVAFDRILVDAPCTASGIVRRHPDIRWLRRRSDLATLSRQQGEILRALWPLLRPGGKLLFATCSVFRAEGEQVIDHFLSERRDAKRLRTVLALRRGRRRAGLTVAAGRRNRGATMMDSSTRCWKNARDRPSRPGVGAGGHAVAAMPAASRRRPPNHRAATSGSN